MTTAAPRPRAGAALLRIGGNEVLKFEARQWMPGPEGQGYTLGDVAYWAWTYLRVSVVTAVSSDPGVLMREAQHLEEAARPFGCASRNRGGPGGPVR